MAVTMALDAHCGWRAALSGCLLAAASCGGSVPALAATGSRPPQATKPATGVTADQGPVLFDGVLLGPDGEPIHGLEIHIRRYGERRAARTETPDGSGYFQAQLPGPGVYFVEVAAPNLESASQIVHAVGPRLRVTGGPGPNTRLQWTGHDVDLAYALEVAREWTAQKGEIFEAGAGEDGPDSRPTEEMAVALRSLAASTLAQADEETSPVRRRLLRMARVDGMGDDLGAGELSSSLGWIVENVAPDDPCWSAFVSFPTVLRRALDDPDVTEDLHEYLDEMVEQHSDRGWAATVLEVRLQYFDSTGDKTQFDRLYSEMQEPRFKDTDTRHRSANRYEAAFEIGRPLPDFDFVSLDNPRNRVRNEDREGRPYLLVFWAPWSTESVGLMDAFHATYGDVNGVPRGKPAAHPKLEFVFISFEASADRVRTFRAAPHTMPWTHGFAPLADVSAVHSEYGFESLPIVVLVGADGNVVATGADVLGPRLATTLQSMGH